MSGWQPIETYNGYLAVLIRTERGFVVSAFKDVTGCWHMTSRDFRGAQKLKAVPRHWMPLPEPPK